MQAITGYTHVQSDPATNWVISHKLNCNPVVQVYIHYQGKLQRVIPKYIVADNPGQVTVVFTTPQTGTATCQ